MKGTTKDIFNKREKPRALRSFDDKSHPSLLSPPLFSFTLPVCIYLNSLPTRISRFRLVSTVNHVRDRRTAKREDARKFARGDPAPVVLRAITLFEKGRVRVK